MNPDYWEAVRYAVARHAAQWSCGTEGRLMFENLCEHEEWQTRLEELAPRALDGAEPELLAGAIVTNYFSQSFQ